LVFFHSTWPTAAEMLVLRFCSSGSKSKVEVSSSTRPSRWFVFVQ
jgi:hypothetical protein